MLPPQLPYHILPASSGFRTTGLGLVLYRDVLVADYHPSAMDLMLHDAIGAHSETMGFQPVPPPLENSLGSGAALEAATSAYQ